MRRFNINYLFWEGVDDTQFNFSTGYCIKGSDTAQFLETELAKQGLNYHFFPKRNIYR